MIPISTLTTALQVLDYVKSRNAGVSFDVATIASALDLNPEDVNDVLPHLCDAGFLRPSRGWVLHERHR